MSRVNSMRGLTLGVSALALGAAALIAAPAMAQTTVVVGAPEGSAPGAVGGTALTGTIALGADGRIVINHNDNSEDGYVINRADTVITGGIGSRIDLLSGTTTLQQATRTGNYPTNDFFVGTNDGSIIVHDGATLQLEGWSSSAAGLFSISAATGSIEIQRGGTLTGQGWIGSGSTSNFTVAGTISPHGYANHDNPFDGPQGTLYIGSTSAAIATFTSTARVEIDIDPNAPTGTRASDLLRIRSNTKIEDGAELQIRLTPPTAGPTNYQLGTKFVFLDMGTDAAVGANHYAFAFDTTQGSLPSGARGTQYVPIGSGPAPAIGDTITVDGLRFIYNGGSLIQPRREVSGDFTLSPDSQTRLTHYLGLEMGSGYASAVNLTTGKFEDIRNSLFMEIVQTRDFAEDAGTRNGKSAAAALQAVGTSNAAYNSIANLKDGDAALDQMSPFFDALSGQIHVGVRGLLTQDAWQVQRSVGRRLSNYELEGAHLWAEAAGGQRQLDSDGEIPDMKEEGQGFLAGIDAMVTGPWRIGVAGGYRSAEIETGDAFAGKAEFDQWQGLIYTSGAWGGVHAQAGAGMASAAIETERNVFLPDIVADRLGASYDGTIVHAFGELSYAHDLGGAVVEPFVGYSIVRASTDGVDEVNMDSDDDSAVALHIGGDQTQVSFATLGLKGRTVSAGALALDGQIGWRRGFGDLALESTHLLNNREGFTVYGANLSENAAVIQAGARWRVTDGVTLDAGYDGVIGDEGQDHTARVGVSLRF